MQGMHTFKKPTFTIIFIIITIVTFNIFYYQKTCCPFGSGLVISLPKCLSLRTKTFIILLQNSKHEIMKIFFPSIMTCKFCPQTSQVLSNEYDEHV